MDSKWAVHCRRNPFGFQFGFAVAAALQQAAK
jgi:hypothetical protein